MQPVAGRNSENRSRQPGDGLVGPYRMCRDALALSGDPKINFIHSTPIKTEFPVASAGMLDLGEITSARSERRHREMHDGWDETR
jgi:hypothetical protein